MKPSYIECSPMGYTGDGVLSVICDKNDNSDRNGVITVSGGG